MKEKKSSYSTLTPVLWECFSFNKRLCVYFGKLLVANRTTFFEFPPKRSAYEFYPNVWVNCTLNLNSKILILLSEFPDFLFEWFSFWNLYYKFLKCNSVSFSPVSKVSKYLLKTVFSIAATVYKVFAKCGELTRCRLIRDVGKWLQN